MTPNRDLHEMSMAELGTYAHDVGLGNVAHMSFTELIEAIEQQRETNDLLLAESAPRKDILGVGGEPPRDRAPREQTPLRPR